MNQKNIIRYIISAIIVVFIIFLGNTLLQKDVKQQDVAAIQQEQEAYNVTVFIENVLEPKNATVEPETTVLDFLRTLDGNDPRIELTTKTYGGLGVLVTGLGGVENGLDNKYWQYHVNGVMPQIAADQLKIKNGDIIEWFFRTSEF